MYQKQIKNLLRNLAKPDVPKRVDVVLEGGAFNGAYELGTLFFLQEMDRNGFLSIERISGTSIGAIMALAFLIGILEEVENIYEESIKEWISSLSIQTFKEHLVKHIRVVKEEELLSTVNDRLYITYFDVTTRQHVTVSTYNSTEHLIDTIFSSCHIPYVTKDTACYQQHIDGIHPHIFRDVMHNDDKDVVYVAIHHWTIANNMFKVSKELYLSRRILEGILQCYELFLHNRSSKMCSFMSQWSMRDFLVIRAKHGLGFILMYVIVIAQVLEKICQPYLLRIPGYSYAIYFIKNILQDVVYCSI